MVPASLLLLFAVRGAAGFLADLALAKICAEWPEGRDAMNRKHTADEYRRVVERIRAEVPGFDVYSTEDIKHRFMNALGTEMRYLPALEGQGMFPVGLKTSTLTVEQFSGLVELIYAFGAKPPK